VDSDHAFGGDAGGVEAPLPSLEETFDDYEEGELFRDR
jgi:hypothetical protein